MTPHAILADGLASLKLAVSDTAQGTLLDYISLISKWNRVYNLTAVREPEKILTHHILDSLAVAPHITGRTLLDIGSGAGLPGIPLALALPDVHFTLLDSNQKKCAFLNQAVIELHLPNVTVVCTRAEDWKTVQTFDVVITRAFSDLAKFVDMALRLCAPAGMLLAMKGIEPVAEIAQLPDKIRLHRVTSLDIPGLDAQRHLIFLQAA